MSRFMRRGTTTVTFDSGAPTPTTAGSLDLTEAIAEIQGFTFANQPISVPDMASTFENKIPGGDAAEDSSITFYEDDTTNPIREALSKGTVGWVVFDTNGAGEFEAYPVIVASSARMYSAGNEAAMYRVVFTVTGAPVEF